MGILALLIGAASVGFISVLASDPDVIMVTLAFLHWSMLIVKANAGWFVFLALLFAGCVGTSATLKFRRELEQ